MLKLICSVLLALGFWGNAQAQQKEVYEGYQGITDPAKAKAAWLKDQEKGKTPQAVKTPEKSAPSAQAQAAAAQKAAEERKSVKRDAAYQARERELEKLKARRGAASEAHKKKG
jgi:hypothetical protein